RAGQGLHGARPLLQTATVHRQVSRWPDEAGRTVQAQRDGDGLRAALRRAVLVEGRLRPVARPGAKASVQSQSLPLQLALALELRQRRQRQPGTASVRHRALGPAEAGAPGQDSIDWRLRWRGVVAG